MRKARVTLGCLRARHRGCSMKINWHAVLSSFLRRKTNISLNDGGGGGGPNAGNRYDTQGSAASGFLRCRDECRHLSSTPPKPRRQISTALHAVEKTQCEETGNVWTAYWFCLSQKWKIKIKINAESEQSTGGSSGDSQLIREIVWLSAHDWRQASGSIFQLLILSFRDQKIKKMCAWVRVHTQNAPFFSTR